MKTGLYFVTANPIHHAHLLVAETVREKYHLDRILFVLTPNPPHKVHFLPFETRLLLLSAAIQSNPQFEVSTIETERVGPHYSVDTIKLLKERYPEDIFYFIAGSDTAKELPSWKNWTELFTLTQVVVVTREHSFNLATVKELYRNKLKPEIIEQLEYIDDIPLWNISSTLIRKLLKEGKSIRYLVPDSVLQLIKKLNLYH